jgi:hypothetical protein
MPEEDKCIGATKKKSACIRNCSGRVCFDANIKVA